MTQEEKRRRIAGVCAGLVFRDEGWRYPDIEDWQKYQAVYRGEGFVGLSKPDWPIGPDYFGDLNACHEMEKTLLPDLSGYGQMLTNICDEYAAQHGYDDLKSWRTTCGPEQRAEAFGLTLNLWEAGQ